MGLVNKIQALWRDSTANALILFAVATPVVLGGAGLATDTIQWSLWKRELQRSADSSALAGAYALARGNDVSSAVERDLTLSYDRTLLSKAIENAPTSGAYAGDGQAVRVLLTYQRVLPFSSLFMTAAPTIEAVATASVLDNGSYCIIALDDTTSPGVTTSGNANIMMGCGIATNSRGKDGVSFGGASSRLQATPVASVGGLTAHANYVGDTNLKPYSVPQSDPLAGLPDPVLPHCTGKLNVQPNKTTDIGPGCWKGWDVKGTLNLAPGVYYIDGSSVDFGSQAKVTGTGVTIIFTSATAATNSGSIATLGINGGAELNLQAPTTGPYAGVLFYQDRRANTGITNSINGNANSHLQGAIYFPRQDISMSGDSGMTTECLQIVSRKISFTGNTRISNTCPPNSGSHDFKGTVVRLVE